MIPKQHISTLFQGSLLILVAACASTKQAGSQKESGFLTDYASMTDGRVGGYAWNDPDFQLDGYSRVHLPPVEVWIDVEASKLTEEDAVRMSGLFHERVVEQLAENGWQVAETAEPGSLTIRLALTELNSANALGNIATSLPYPTTAAVQLASATADVHVFVGKVSTELQIVDTDSGKVMAEAMDRRVGTHALTNIGSTWGDVSDAMTVWAKRIGSSMKKSGDA